MESQHVTMRDKRLAGPSCCLSPIPCELPACPLLQHITLRRAWVCCSSWRSLACVWRTRFCVSMEPVMAAALPCKSPASAAAASACSRQPLCCAGTHLWTVAAQRCQH